MSTHYPNSVWKLLALLEKLEIKEATHIHRNEVLTFCHMFLYKKDFGFPVSQT